MKWALPVRVAASIACAALFAVPDPLLAVAPATAENAIAVNGTEVVVGGLFGTAGARFQAT